MAKAIIGSTVDAHTFRLLEEIRALRNRVGELEAALAEAETALDEYRDHESVVSGGEQVLDLDDKEVEALRNAMA